MAANQPYCLLCYAVKVVSCPSESLTEVRSAILKLVAGLLRLSHTWHCLNILLLMKLFRYISILIMLFKTTNFNRYNLNFYVRAQNLKYTYKFISLKTNKFFNYEMYIKYLDMQCDYPNNIQNIVCGNETYTSLCCYN